MSQFHGSSDDLVQGVAERRLPPHMTNIMGQPKWHHHHAHKICVESVSPDGKSLTLTASAAKLTIEQTESYSYKDGPLERRWLVSWEVRYSRTEKTNGCGNWGDKDLQQAFGLIPSEGKIFGFLRDFICDAAAQGKYIRWEDALNIPCPGTGHDGDPNISILIDDQIQNAIRTILAWPF
jgi:hypothetical protein